MLVSVHDKIKLKRNFSFMFNLLQTIIHTGLLQSTNIFHDENAIKLANQKYTEFISIRSFINLVRWR